MLAVLFSVGLQTHIEAQLSVQNGPKSN